MTAPRGIDQALSAATAAVDAQTAARAAVVNAASVAALAAGADVQDTTAPAESVTAP